MDLKEISKKNRGIEIKFYLEFLPQVYIIAINYNFGKSFGWTIVNEKRLYLTQNRIDTIYSNIYAVLQDFDAKYKLLTPEGIRWAVKLSSMKNDLLSLESSLKGSHGTIF